VRIVIILILILLGTGIFALRSSYFKKVFPPPEKEVPQLQPEAPIEIPPIVQPPPSLMEVGEEKTFEISQISDIPSLFDSALETDLLGGEFTRILFKNVKENKFVTLAEFFEAFQVKTPEDFYQKIVQDHTLFIFTQPEGKRFGFLVQTGEGLGEIVESWEGTMENDFANLFSALGKENPALRPDFQQARREEVPFRYLTFIEQEDFGICYFTSGQYFAWASSCTSLLQVMEKIFQNEDRNS